MKETADAQVKPVDARKAEFFPSSLQEAETRLMEERRQGVNPGGAAETAPTTTVKHFSVAFSGGGIRSATFCLGALQSLARGGLAGRVDYLSTVSGGGYLGAFWAKLCVRVGVTEAAQRVADNFSAEVRWLRNNGRHLAPNGAGDMLTAMAVQFRNWVSVVLLMILTTATLFLGLNLMKDMLCEWVVWPVALKPLFAEPPTTEFWWLSVWILPAGLAGAVALTMGWSYWLIPGPRDSRLRHLPWLTHAFLLAVWLRALLTDKAALVFSLISNGLNWTFFGIATAALIFFGVNWLVQSSALRAVSVPPWEIARKLRHSFSIALRKWLIITGVCLALALLDTLGQSLYMHWYRHGLSSTFQVFWSASGLALVLSLGDKLSPWVERLFGGRGGAPSMKLLATAVGLAGFGVFLLNCNMLAQGLIWEFQDPQVTFTTQWGLTAITLGICAALVLLAGRHMPFVNNSSLQSLYGSRLVRAYLGASNPARHQAGGRRVTETIPGDEIWLSDYRPHARGGPLHLINVTLNETFSEEHEIDQRDRRGTNLTVGPCGLTVGRRHHALWCEGEGKERGAWIEPIPVDDPAERFQVFPGPARQVQNLSVGHWMAISGAAFGTGLGSRTSLGLSLIAGLANIRLGYWWNSRITPADRHHSKHRRWQVRRAGEFVLPAQSHLLTEWIADFRGPGRPHWYLSDGGHFENTAVYELLRRRVSHVVCCDCGQDPQYALADVGNLVRKARIDFGAEITLLNTAQIEALRAGSALPLPPEVGGCEKFTGENPPPAFLGSVRHRGEDQPSSLILFVKPALAGNEPVDVREYKTTHPTFPQESTSDQFFDEAQWESYRKLGEHIGAALFTTKPDDKWWFTELKPG